MQGARERETFVPTHDFAPGSGFPSLRASRTAMRALLEAWIEAAIDLLDTLDGDADLEDGGDAEPSLGAIEVSYRKATLHPLAGKGCLDRLCDEGGLDQTLWGAGDRTDREAGDDTGIADSSGVAEQSGCVWFGDIEDVSRRSVLPTLAVDGTPRVFLFRRPVAV